MISFWRIFWLELLTLLRTRTWLLLLVAVTGWVLAFPAWMAGDGTAAGTRELLIHYSLGGAFALTVVALLASATGSIAAERAALRLQLTLLRPVRYTAIALAKILALLTAGASVLAVAALVLFCSVDRTARCSHVLSPVLPSVASEAERAYELYMRDPKTPPEVRQASKSSVLRVLNYRIIDSFMRVMPGETVKLRFDGLNGVRDAKVRMRFSGNFSMRHELRGVFSLGGAETTVSNMTQSVLTVPLQLGDGCRDELRFRNDGTSMVMFRPRRDLDVLVPADSFGCNLFRAWIGLVAILALVIALGMFLSSALGRPVALFVAFSILIVGEISPSVVGQYPNEFEADLIDRIGLCITDAVAEIVRPIDDLSPLEPLAKGECVEWRTVGRMALVDLLALPLVLALLAGVVMPRKSEDRG